MASKIEIEVIVKNSGKQAIAEIGSDLEKVTKDAKKNYEDLNKIIISHYKDIDAAEKVSLSAAEQAANAKKFAAQKAATDAYSKQKSLDESLVANFEANKQRQLRADKRAWEQMLADERKYEASSKQANAVLQTAAKQLADYRIKESKRANDSEIASLKNRPQQNPLGGLVSQGVVDSFIGNLGANIFMKAIGAAGQMIQEVENAGAALVSLGGKAILLASDFEVTTNSIAVFSGNLTIARNELAQIDTAAKNTPGLRLESAEDGYRQLRALKFEAADARKLIVGLAKEKVISGADEGAAQRVISNLTQIKSGVGELRDVKEMIKAIPSLQPVISQEFGSIYSGKFKDLLENHPDEVLKRLAEAMDKVKTVDGGLNDALGKTSDAWISLGRSFGEPLLPELTKDVKAFTSALEENKDRMAIWGANFSDTIAGIRSLAPSGKGADQLINANANASALLNPPLWAPLATAWLLKQRGRNLKAQEEFAKRASVGVSGPPIKNLADLRHADDTNLLDNTAFDPTAINERKRKEQETFLTKQFQKDTAISAQGYKILEAQLANHLDFTTQEQLKTLTAQTELKNQALRDQIAIDNKYYDDQIKNADGDKEKIAVFNEERAKAVSAANNEIKVNEINTQRQIKEYEQKILDERRQNRIQFNSLLIETSKTSLDKQVFDLQRSISLSDNLEKESYAKLIDLTNQSYQEVLRLTRENYAEQLKHKSLTSEQIKNLNKQEVLEEVRLKEDNRRKIIQIEDQQYKDSLEKADRYTDRLVQILSSTGALYGSVSSSINPLSINSSYVKNLGDTFFGGDIDEYLKPFEDRIAAVTPRLNNAKQGILELNKTIGLLSGKELAEATLHIGGFQVAIDESNNTIKDAQSGIDGINSKYTEFSKTLFRMIRGYNDGTVSIRELQKAQLDLFDTATKTKVAEYDAQIKNLQDKLNNPGSGTAAERDNTKLQRDKLIDEKNLYLFDRQNQKTEQFNQTLVGLEETIAKLADTNSRYNKTLEDSFQIDRLQQEKAQLTDIRRLEFEIRSPKNAAYQIQKANLEEIISLRQKETDAIILRNKSLLEISQKGVFSKTQGDAKILDFLNQNTKSLTDIYADTKIKGIETFWDTMDKGVSKFTDHLGFAKDLVHQLFTDLLKYATNKFILKLLNIDPSGGASGQGGFGGSGGQSGGLNLGSLFGGNAGGGIFNFGGGGSKGGAASGLLSKIPGLGSLLGAGAGIAAGAGTAAAAGGITTAGGVLGTTIGLEGGGTFTAGAAGGGLLGALTPLFTNPWTAVAAGAAIGGYFLLKHFFGDKSIKRLHEAAESQYGLDVKDKNVLTAIKGFGDQQLGKGTSSSNPIGVIRLEDSKNALRAYAEASGQSTSKLGASQQDLQSEGYSGNRFISKIAGFRAFGGPVAAGSTYIVGERGPETFTSGTGGTITPGVGDSRLLTLVLGQIQETLGQIQARLQMMTPGQLLAIGASENPSAINAAVQNITLNDPKFNANFRRNQGGDVPY